MNAEIIKSIERRLLLRFLYKGKLRCVEPHTYGQQMDGQEILCAWQVSGGSGSDFRYFLMKEISIITVNTRNFGGPRPTYHRGDRRFIQIFSEL